MKDQIFYIRIRGVPVVTLIRHRISPRRQPQPANSSDHPRICRVRGGRGEWTIGSRAYPIGAGDIFVLNNTEYRAIHTVHPPETLELEILDVDERRMEEGGTGVCDWSDLHIWAGRGEAFTHRIAAEKPVAVAAGRLFDRMWAEMENGLPASRQMAIACLLELAATLHRHGEALADGTVLSEPARPSRWESMRKVRDYIDAHLAESLSLSRLALMVPMNPSYFSRLFTRCFGIGPSRYINHRRVQAAIALLGSTDQSVSEIAGLCGYNNASSFYKAFTAVTGSHPLAYRHRPPGP